MIYSFHSKNPARKKTIRLLSAILFLAAGLVLVIGILTFHQQHLKNEAAIKRADSNVSAPSTVKPTAIAIASYSVAADLPRYIIIPSINVYARVESIGLTSSGEIGTPDNIYDTAWYKGSSKPGQPGAMLIDGHVAYWTTDGVFHNLDKLVPGDFIKIVRGDGTIYYYKVVKVQVYASNNVDMANVVKPVNPATPGLNLISCTGDVIKNSNEMNERIVVFSQQAAITQPTSGRSYAQ